MQKNVCDIGTSDFTTDRNSLTNRGALNVLDMVEVDDNLRSRSTYWFKKGYSERPYDFPNQNVLGYNAFVKTDPRNTRSDLQNVLLIKRHFDK